MGDEDYSGEAVKAALAKDWVHFERTIQGYLQRKWPQVQVAHDDILSDVMFGSLQDAAKLEARCPLDASLPAFILRCLYTRAKWGAINALKKLSAREGIADHATRDESEDVLERLPVPIMYPEQEDIVWMKQVIERLGMHEDDVAKLRLIFERSTLSEMLSKIDALHQVLDEMKRGDVRGVVRLKKELAA